MKQVHAITAMSRFDLLDTLVEHYGPMDIVWHPVMFESEANLSDWPPGKAWIQPLVIPNVDEFAELVGRGEKRFPIGHYKKNAFVKSDDINNDDYYWFLDDDDMIEASTVSAIKEMDDDVIFISMKRGHHVPADVTTERAYPTWPLIAAPENVKVGLIGQQQYICKGEVLKQIHYDEQIHHSDGLVAIWLKENFPIRYEKNLYVLFNYFEPGRWEKEGDVGMVSTEQKEGLTSIVIPVWNQAEITHECILAIMENTESFEIIVVDNGSDPPFKVPFVSSNEIRIIRNEENKGFPIAANQGVRDANGDVVVLFNNDIIVTPQWAERLRAWLEPEQIEVTEIGDEEPRFVVGREGFDIIAPMTNFSAGVQGTTIGSYQSRDELDEAAEEFSEENEGNCLDVNFCTIGMFVKRKVFDDIGYLDETLWPSSGEDIDFGFRARIAGYRVGVAGDVYVHHEGSQTFKAMQEAGLIDYGEVVDQNDKYLAEKYGKDFWSKQIYYGQDKIISGDAIRLNLGCGRYPMEDFINIDKSKDVNPDLLADATDTPYYPNTVDEIYCGYMLEHLTWDEGQKALKHWLSMLKPGAEIRILVPDFDVLAKTYLENPSPTKMKHLNDYFIYSYDQESHHKYFYSKALLKEAMEKAGFVDIVPLPYDHPYIVDPMEWQAGFVGVKP